jgi:hypothetical protein
LVWRKHLVTRRLHQLIAVWFVLQIVMPFTAPLQTIDFHDLFGGSTHSRSSSSPESSTTPTIRDTAGASALSSLLDPVSLRPCATIVVARDIRRGSATVRVVGRPLALSVQRSVLRI